MKKWIHVIAIVLVTAGQSFAQTSVFEELRSYTKNEFYVYNTKGHYKSLGVGLKLNIPKSWQQQEGNRPYIVQKFSRQISKLKAAVCVIHISKLPSELLSLGQEKQIAEILFSEEVLSSFILSGGKTVGSQRTEYDGQPGLMLVYVAQGENAGLKLVSYNVSHKIIFKSSHIDVTCSYAGPASSFFTASNVNEELKAFQLLSRLIGNSIVLDKW